LIHFYKRERIKPNNHVQAFRVRSGPEPLQQREIQTEFEKYGMVTDVYNTGKGYAFVTFDRKEDSKMAIQEMDGQTMLGQQIKVNAARPNEGGGRRWTRGRRL
jgi:RNA recognition motif-containing protein